MVPVKSMIEKVKSAVRGIMFEVAKLLDELSNGFIKPNHVTFLSLAGHVFILLAITQEQFVEAAVMLIGFGLLDRIDICIDREGVISLQSLKL